LSVYTGISSRPVLAASLGALIIAFSAILVRVSGASPLAAAVYRCAYATPVLWTLARLEDRRFGARPLRGRLLAAAAGTFLAADLVLWHRAIVAVGAGLATVLANLQVVVVAIVAWLVLGERPQRRVLLAVPLALVGVGLVSGALEQGAYGREPALGAGLGALASLTYAAFLLLLRESGRDLRRPAGPLSDATIAAAVIGAAAGAALAPGELVPSWPAHGWLVVLALVAQVVGWLLISVSLPRLPASLTSAVLLIQPAASVALARLLLDEIPTRLQLLGVALILAGVLLATRKPAQASSADAITRSPCSRRRRSRSSAR
jgi:drug/metabolite transporter (DMT)-like permease